MAFKFVLFTLSLSAAAVLSPVLAQPTCTPAMITSFMPCLNFTTVGSANGSAPSQDCCSSLKTLMTSGKDCLCLIASGTVPFQIPINRTLAVSLPRACNMPGVPMQCKVAGSGAPAPAPTAAAAPGPATNGPSVSPAAAPSPSITGQSPPESQSPGSAPGADTTPVLTPPSPTANGGPPGSSTGSSAGVTPSGAAQLPTSVSFMQIWAVVALVSLKYF